MRICEGQAGASWRSSRLLEEGLINDLLLDPFGILRVSLITFPTQYPGVEATGNERFVF